MTAFVHRQGDSRSCGASTVTKIANVRVNNLAISTDGDTNTHGGGGLIAGQTVGSVRAGGIPVILNGDNANPDALCPIPGLSCHFQEGYISPYVNWEEIFKWAMSHEQ